MLAAPAYAVPDLPTIPDFHKYCMNKEYEPLKGEDFPRYLEKRPWERDWLKIDKLRQFATGKDVKVAVLDSGTTISENHPPDKEIAENLQFHAASIDKDNRADFAEDDEDQIPDSDTRGAFFDCDVKEDDKQGGYHGTKVASLIMAQPIDRSGMVGIAPGVTLLPIRVMRSADEGKQGNLAKGIRHAVDSGAQIISTSVVSYSNNNELREAIEYADQRDVLVVTAAGNKRQDSKVEPGTGYPAMYAAKYPNVISVGSHNEFGYLSAFSEFNAVTVAAPGDGVTTAFPFTGNYDKDRGTSFAQPLVAGTAALLIDQANQRGQTLKPVDIRRRIELTADDAPGADKPDEGFGYGLLDPYAALSQPIADPNATVPPENATGVKPLAAPKPPDNTLRNIALALTGLSVLTAIAILAVRSSLRTMRRRA